MAKAPEILFFCPRWGHAHLSWKELAQRAKDAGYDGIETDIPESPAEQEALFDALARFNLKMVAQHWETMDPRFDVHARLYEQRLQHLAAAKPWCINSHTGRDFFTSEENGKLIALAALIETTFNVPVYHETHRGRFSFAAHVTLDYFRRHPGLRITWDVSHWIVVAESLLADQQDAVDTAAAHTGHIHARVGHPQGSQVADPVLQQWEEVLAVHLAYWDKAVAAAQAEGRSQLGFTPEFGPVPYMPLHPDSGKPVRDQWELNVAMMELLKKRYAQK